ncbi:MAG: putative sensor protein [Nitrospira sp.]|nr:putative sensor protein [Nitrospira sp.]
MRSVPQNRHPRHASRQERKVFIVSSLNLITLLITALVFGLDLLTPSGVAVGVLYVAAVLTTVRSIRPAATWQIATLSSVLVIAESFPLSTVSLLTPYALANRALALITIWVTAILVRNYRQRTAETARLAALVTSSDDAILSTTLDGRIETWNAGAEHLCAYQATEIMGQPLSMLLPEDRQQELADMLTRVKNGEHIQPVETVWTTKDNRVRRVSLTISPIIDDRGMTVSASTIVQDITQQKEAEDERSRLLAELQDALANVKRLEGLLSVCASCKKIRDGQGEWVPIEVYISEHSDAVFSHGYCPLCAQSFQHKLEATRRNH